MPRMRKVVISVEVETCLAVRELREVAFIAFGIKPMRRTTIRQVMPDGINHDCRGTIVQVRCEVAKPESSEQERRDARAKLAKKFADEVSKWPAKKLRACFAQPETVAAAEDRERKARRAKGAK